MAEAAQEKGSGGSKLAWLLVLGLLGAVWWLASERNARKFTYEVRAGELVIAKGRYFPTATAAIGPGDGALGKLYGAIPVPPGTKAVAEAEFEDQGALDRALFDLLTGWARAAAQKHDASGQQLAEELVGRLTGLSGLTPAQLGDLQALRAALGWWSAGKDLESALKVLAAARHKLEEVRRGDVEHAGQAAALLGPLDALSQQLAELAAGRSAAAAPFVAPAVGATPNTPVGTPATTTPSVPAGAAPLPSAPDAGTAATTTAAPVTPATPTPAVPAKVATAPASGSAAPAADAGTALEKSRGRASAPSSVSSGAPR